MFNGGSVSKKATAIAGLLFGPMGMATGALFTHKPAHMKVPDTFLDISSETNKIDDRSVILNYYSDVKQQFMDIELPSDIYNFLQTHLPDKKYSIVLEIEKKKALDKYKVTDNYIEKKQLDEIEQDDDMQAFESKIKKLAIMRKNGILSEEEFEQEKKRILAEL